MFNFHRRSRRPARWGLPDRPGKECEEIAEALGLSRLTASILLRRLEEPTIAAARRFLRPSLRDLASPWELSDMRQAAERLARAIRDKERIVVHGDYDADGVTATAVLLRVLAALGNPARYYLPHRVEEGYGISPAFVETMRREGADLVVTVDCGVSEHASIAALASMGIDVIVTDHHELAETLPPGALAVVNPKRDATGFRELSGVGVAFKLAWAVCEAVVGKPKVGPFLQQTLLSCLPLVAMGTIADVASLRGENRTLVVAGLPLLGKNHPGIAALLAVSGLGENGASATDVAFRIAPRLNAAGRMGEADLALAILQEEDEVSAETLAKELDRRNAERQRICQAILGEARVEVEATHYLRTDRAIVVAKEGWHEGVLGIVAGRLAEEFGLPAAVIALSGDRGKGSARSIPGLNLHAVLAASHTYLTSFGGHEEAAGFTLRRENVAAFRQAFQTACRAVLGEEPPGPELAIDAEVRLAELHEGVVSELELLAPFGQGNPRPKLLARGVRIAGSPRFLGNEGRHFSFYASQNGTALRAIVFDNPSWLESIEEGVAQWDLVFSVERNSYRPSTPTVELKILDMRPASGR